MLPTFCVTVSPNFSQIDISVIEINSVLGIGVSLSIYYIILQFILFSKILKVYHIQLTISQIWQKFILLHLKAQNKGKILNLQILVGIVFYHILKKFVIYSLSY